MIQVLSPIESEREVLATLGEISRSTMYRGFKTQNVRVSRDVVDRVSLLLGIYKGLRILFKDSQQAMSWIDRENRLPPFNGQNSPVADDHWLLRGSRQCAPIR